MTARAGDAAFRSELRAARRQMSESERARADQAILDHVRNMPEYRKARHVALFFSFDGEPDLSPLIRFDQPRRFYAPVIHGHDMHFAVLGKNCRLELNRFGIPEPWPAEVIESRALDLVLTPLVGFDSDGHRVGVGGGFYDRCFAFLRHRKSWYKPRLAGVAYECQKVESIAAQPWDIPLWGAITEQGCTRFR